MDEKGKNLATKEDIEEITRKTEEVQQEFREGFELFSNDVKFKYIQSSKEIIARKKKSIFQEEIDEEQQRINEAERLIKELDEKTKSQEEE